MRSTAEALAQVPYQYWHDLKQTVSSWLGHEDLRLAASLSLYSLLYLAPLVILTIAITSLAQARSMASAAMSGPKSATGNPSNTQVTRGTATRLLRSPHALGA
jgi:uncharacterized BrkB/YihY/UPF0761 family membrane protein